MYKRSRSISNIVVLTIAVVLSIIGSVFGFHKAFILVLGLGVFVIFVIKFERAFLAFLILRPAFDMFSGIGLQIGYSFLNLSSVMSILFDFSATTFIVREKKHLLLPKELYTFAYFLGFAFISTVYNFEIVKWDGLFSFFRLVTVFLIMVIIWLEYRDNEKIDTLLTCLAVSTIIPLFYAISQLLMKFNMTVEDGIPRINGGFAHSNVFASYIGIFVIFSFSILMVRKYIKFTNKIILFLWLTLLLFCLLFTYGRGVWLSLSLTLVINGLLFYRKIFILGIFLTAFIIICLSLTFEKNILLTTIANRFEDVQFWRDTSVLTDPSNSLGWRILYWMDLIKEASKSPIIGYGLGSVINLGRENMEAHNNYVQVFFETGLGALFYFLCLIMFIVRSFKGAKAVDNSKKYLYIAAGGIIVYYFILSLSAHLIRSTVFQFYFYAILAAILCYDKQNI